VSAFGQVDSRVAHRLPAPIGRVDELATHARLSTGTPGVQEIHQSNTYSEACRQDGACNWHTTPPSVINRFNLRKGDASNSETHQ
jgi:hypothetical protein